MSQTTQPHSRNHIISYAGRPHRVCRVSIVPDVFGVVLRLDDDDCPEWWQELRIPAGEIERWATLVQELRGCPPEMSSLVIEHHKPR